MSIKTSVVRRCAPTLAALAVGCGAQSTEDPELLGIATAMLTNVPSDVACLEITVTGNRSTDRLRDVTAGQDAVFTMNGLPVGDVVFEARAFSSECAAVSASSEPTWVGDPLAVTLIAGVDTPVSLSLRRNGLSTVSIDFNDGPDAGGAPLVCSAGTADCNLDPADGCEADLLTDASNCGSCGSACAAGAGSPTCSAGRCITTVAVLSHTPSNLAVDATSVYWTKGDFNGAILKAPKSGGAPVTLASSQANPSALAIDATKAYWPALNDGTIMSVGLSGGSPVTIASTPGPKDLVVDSTSIYFLTTSSLMKVGIAGGGLTALVGTSGQHLAVDSSAVYWTTLTGGTVEKIALGGGASTVLASGLGVTESIALGASDVFFANNSNDTLMRVGKSGGAAVALYGATTFIRDIAVDATGVYIATGVSGDVVKVALDGSTATTLASGQGNILSVAVDGSDVYWGTTGGLILKASKN